MTSISRRLPQSKKMRDAALKRAKDKKDSSPPSGNILTPPTTTRLDTIQPDYEAAMKLVRQKEYTLRKKSTAKRLDRTTLDLYTRSFVKAFNIGIDLGTFEADDRVLLGLPTDGTLPSLSTEQEILDIGSAIIDGDAIRVAGGGAPMVLVDIATYTTQYDSFKTLFDEHSNLTQELDIAQEAVDALNDEADAVIKKVWDEVETFYNEEVKESQRADAREWGVVYISVGIKPSIISGTMLDSVTNLPLPQSANPEVYLEGPDITASVKADGTYSIETTFVGTTNITGLGLGYEDNAKTVNIQEGSANNVGFIMTPV